MDIFERMRELGIIPVVTINETEDAVPLCTALSDGGLPVAEITFRTSAAEEAIRLVHEALPDVLLLAGTVLTVDQVKRAMAAGAAAIVSPGLNPTVVGYCVENGIPVCPGISSASEIETALSFGLHTVKVFPAEAIGGARLIRSLSAPYRDMRFMPTGGIGENNLTDYMSLPSVLCCGGSWMVPSDAVASKNWTYITSLTYSAIDRLLGLEMKKICLNTMDREQAFRFGQIVIGLSNHQTQRSSGILNVSDVIQLPSGREPGHETLLTFGCNDIRRAVFHLSRRGFVFDTDHMICEKGIPTAVDLKTDLAGYSFRLIKK